MKLTKQKHPKTKVNPGQHVSARTHELEPLVALWIEKHPGAKSSELVRRALKHCPDLREIAGKRFAHLLAETSCAR